VLFLILFALLPTAENHVAASAVRQRIGEGGAAKVLTQARANATDCSEMLRNISTGDADGFKSPVSCTREPTPLQTSSSRRQSVERWSGQSEDAFCGPPSLANGRASTTIPRCEWTATPEGFVRSSRVLRRESRRRRVRHVPLLLEPQP
jgi:hypothetical protein